MTAPVTSAPMVLVVKITPTRWTRLVEVVCPFGCRRRHVHGWPYGQDEIGERVAHCRPRRGQPAVSRGYFIVKPREH